MSPVDQLKENVAQLADEEKWEAIRPLLREQHPADLAALITFVPSESREKIFGMVEEDAKPDVLAELEGRAEEEVLESLSNIEISHIVEEMAPDDAADVIADLSEDRSEQVLGLMETEESEEVRELLKYDEESAGGIMTPDVLTFREDLTVKDALDQIAYTDLDEPLYNAYIIDAQRRVKGYIELWEMLRIKDRSASLSSLIHEEVISTTTSTDQEDVARQMAKYDLTAIPVVDDQQRLVGRVTVDDVIDVISEEASEDIFKLAGSDDEELEDFSTVQACRSRLPWLLITMLITFASSLVLKQFMLNLSEVLALSFFVPIIMAMCGSTGMQSSTLIIRSLALKALEGRSISRLLLREVFAGAIMGVICGVLLAVWAKFVITISPGYVSVYSPLFLGSTAGIALVCAMTFAAVFGASVPIILNRLGADPAVASGPFVTASNDILALLIYYGVTLCFVAARQNLLAG